MSHLAFRPAPARVTSIGLVVLLHVALLYAFFTCVLTTVVLPPPDISVHVIPEAEPHKAQPLPPIPTKPLTVPKTIDMPPVVIDEMGGGGTAISDLAAPRLDPRYPAARPDYPAGAVRLGEEGSVLVNVLVAADGGVSDVRLERSSRYPLLDQAALDHARRHFRFLPATQAGLPVAAWHRITITFRLNEAQGN